MCNRFAVGGDTYPGCARGSATWAEMCNRFAVWVSEWRRGDNGSGRCYGPETVPQHGSPLTTQPTTTSSHSREHGRDLHFAGGPGGDKTAGHSGQGADNRSPIKCALGNVDG